MRRTVGELRAALDGLPDDAEFIVCVDAAQVQQDGLVFVDPGAVTGTHVLRPSDDGWPFTDDDGPPALAYLTIGEW